MTATRGPSAPDLQTTLARQVETLSARLRPWSAADWEQPSSNPGWSNARTAQHVVGTLDRYAIGVERGAEASRPPLPDDPTDMDARRVPYRLQAAGERLVDLLRATEPADLVWHRRFRFSAKTMAAVALSEVVLHRWDLTGPGERGPEPRAARLVLQGLFASHDDSGASPTALLLHVTGRARIEGRPGWAGPEWRWELPDEVATDRAEP